MRRMILIGIAVIAVIASLLALSAALTVAGTRWIERAHPATGKFIDVAGARLHVVELDGRKQPSPDDLPVVLLHGASGNLEDMRLALGERLAARHRVILVDRPGHGWSERLGTDDMTPARQSAM